MFEHVVRFPAVSEVACRDAIRQARVTRVKSKGLTMLSKVRLARSESGAHHVFRKFGQSLEVKLSYVDLVSKNKFPYVTFTNWLKYLVETDNMDQLVGVRDLETMKKTLDTFWSRYEKIHPQHVIHQRTADGGFSKDMCIPVLHHGDEGRGLKKRQLMVLSTHGILGKGSNVDNDACNPNPLGPLRLNMIGNTFLTHFLYCVLPIYLYNDTPEAFYKMLDIQAREFRSLFENGVVIQGRRYFICCLAVKGDAPYLAKSGMLERSFSRKPTRPSSRTACAGICHLCCAGKEDFQIPVPFEEYGVENPAWLQTVGLLKPWSDRSPMLQIPYEVHCQSETFFRYDLFHNFHSGMGKYFASSAVCICLELVDSTIDGAFQNITADFKEYCARKRECPYHKALTQSLFGVAQGFQDWPDASWSKGDFTRLILQWFEDYASRNVMGHTMDPLYIKCVPCPACYG